MTLNLSGLLLAGTLSMLAAVLAWPLQHPAAAALLIAQAATHLAVAAYRGWIASRPRSGRDPRTGRWVLLNRTPPVRPLTVTPAARREGR